MVDFQPYSESHVVDGEDWNQLLDHGLLKPYSYIVRVRDDGVVEAVNGGSGRIEFSGSDAVQVINDVVEAVGGSGGGRILLKSGTYKLTDRIVIPYNDVVLEGEGPSTLLDQSEHIGGDVKQAIYAGHETEERYRVVIRNLRIRQRESSIGYGWHEYAQIKLRHLYDFVVESVWLEQTYNDGIAASNCKRGVIKDIYVEVNRGDGGNLGSCVNVVCDHIIARGYGSGDRWGSGWWLAGYHKLCTLMNSAAWQLYEYGFAVESGAHSLVIGCVAYSVKSRSNSAGINIYNNPIVSVVGCGFFNCRAGIRLNSTYRASISDCHFYQCYEGIVGEGTNGLRNAVISGCIFDNENWTVNDINLNGNCQNILIHHNWFRDPPKLDNIQGSNIVFRRNMNYPTENSGVATIPSGQSSVTFNHGLKGVAPDGGNLKVVLGPKHSEVADAVWTADSTQITITVPNPVSADRQIAWYAEV